MDQQPLVSVVIPAYNCEKYIAETLDSVISQTYSNLEIIVVNDCSTDNTEQVILEYEKKDRRIKYLKNGVNSGVAKTRNGGVAVANGEWIAFLDSDDIWNFDKIEKQINHLYGSKGYFCYTSYSFVDGLGRDMDKVFTVPETVDYRGLLRKHVINCSTVIIKRDILIQHPMIHDDLHEDYIAWLSILKSHGKALGLTESLTVYRQVKQSKSNNKFRSFILTNEVYKLEGIRFFSRIYYLWCYSLTGIKKYWL